MAWKLNSRCSRSSRNRRRMALPSRPKPPSRTSFAATSGRESRSRGESKLRSMKCGISATYRSWSQSTKPSNAAASTEPQVSAISFRIASRP